MTELMTPSMALVKLIQITAEKLNISDLEEIKEQDGAALDDFIDDTKTRGTAFMVSFQSMVTSEPYTDGELAEIVEDYVIYFRSRSINTRTIARALVDTKNTDTDFRDLTESVTKNEDRTSTTTTFDFSIQSGEVILYKKEAVFQMPVKVTLNIQRSEEQ